MWVYCPSSTVQNVQMGKSPAASSTHGQFAQESGVLAHPSGPYFKKRFCFKPGSSLCSGIPVKSRHLDPVGRTITSISCTWAYWRGIFSFWLTSSRQSERNAGETLHPLHVAVGENYVRLRLFAITIGRANSTKLSIRTGHAPEERKWADIIRIDIQRQQWSWEIIKILELFHSAGAFMILWLETILSFLICVL